jgi:hypothetical protein
MEVQQLSPQQPPELPSHAQKKPNTALTVLVGVILLGFGLLGTFMLFNGNNIQPPPISNSMALATPTPIPLKEENLDEKITYTILSGWRKVVYSPNNISLESPNHTYNAAGQTATGARINITSRPLDATKTLSELLLASLPKVIKEENPPKVENALYDGFNAVHAISCWEGCYDQYFISDNTSLIEIGLVCATNSGSPTEVKNCTYQKDLNVFLNTLSFTKNSNYIEDKCGMTEYLSYGCGTCQNVTPTQKCLYRSKGESLCDIKAADEKLRENPQACANVACSRGIKYRYCD